MKVMCHPEEKGLGGVLVPYSLTSVIKNKKNLNHRVHREHRGEKKKCFFSVLSVNSVVR